MLDPKLELGAGGGVYSLSHPHAFRAYSVVVP